MRDAARAWTIGLLSTGVLLTAIAVVLEARAGWPQGAPAFLAGAVTAISWLAAGGVAAYARPRMSIGYLLLAGGLFLAVSGMLTSWAEVLAPVDPASAAWIGWVGGWMFWPQLAASAIIYLVFPDGALPSTRWRFAYVLAAGGALVGAIATAFAPGPLAVSGPLGEVQNPVGILPGVEGLLPVAALVLNAAFVTGLVALRVRRVAPALRPAVRLVFWLGLVNLAVGLLLVAPPGAWAYALGVPVTISLSAAVCAAVVRGPLWDVRATLGRAIVALVLTAVIVVIFVALVWVVGLLPVPDAGRLLGIPIAALVVCVCFAPTQQWLRRGMERLLFGRRDEPYAVVSGFGAVLETAGEPRDALQKLVQLAAAALRVPWVAVLIPAAGPDPVATAGAPTDATVTRTLRHQGQEQGQLVVGLRGGERQFSAADAQLLDDLARQAGAAAFALASEATLRSHGAQLTAVREEERHRLRRDLHDGIASRVTAVRLTVDVAADLVPDDADRAVQLLGRASRDLAGTLTDLRRIVDGLGPTETLDLGLAQALVLLAERFSSDTFTVVPHIAAAVDAVDPSVASAVYWIAAEAVHNTAKHADAHRGDLFATLVGSDLELRVADDGRGMPAAKTAGVGLMSMRARADAHGGRLSVDVSAAGGVEIIVRVPAGVTHA